MHIVHIAAENDSLPDAKVGGVADVVRDIASALGDLGHQVTVLTPSYGFLHQRTGTQWVADIGFAFRGTVHQAQLYTVPAKTIHKNVRHYVIQHPALEAVHARTGQYRIYVHDPPDRPFFSDASRFACFCSAAAAALTRGAITGADVVHLHDWHMGLVALLRKYHPECKGLQAIRTVFTIHNAAMQGVRPLEGSRSSLAAWFPEITCSRLDVGDPRWPDTCNLMACGIRLADRVHTVSPTYAQEICRPGDPPHFYGAQGLEAALTYEKETKNLVGILNGCDYPAHRRAPVMDIAQMADAFVHRIIQWSAGGQTVSSAHFIACHTLSDLHRPNPGRQMILCSVTRLTEQKVLLMTRTRGDEPPAIARILTALGDDGIYCLLGTGEERFERFFTRISGQFSNFVFLNGFSDEIAQILYANGDLFLMPSSFEPCGISQMLAMRDGQPCVVHAVGGLRDTVRHDVNGFCFEGKDLNEQAQGFVDTTCRAIHMYRNEPEKWQKMKNEAAAARFLWQDTARQYVTHLYTS
jgi:starch synthase